MIGFLPSKCCGIVPVLDLRISVVLVWSNKPFHFGPKSWDSNPFLTIDLVRKNVV